MTKMKLPKGEYNGKITVTHGIVSNLQSQNYGSTKIVVAINLTDENYVGNRMFVESILDPSEFSAPESNTPLGIHLHRQKVAQYFAGTVAFFETLGVEIEEGTTEDEIFRQLPSLESSVSFILRSDNDYKVEIIKLIEKRTNGDYRDFPLPNGIDFPF